MRCVELEPLLSDYADGIADERGRRIVERHIQLCHTCYDGVLLARRIGQQLMRLSLLPLGIVDRTPRLQRRLEQRFQRRRYDVGRLAERAVVGLLAIILGLLLWFLVSGAIG